jgi:hypothetical protein
MANVVKNSVRNNFSKVKNYGQKTLSCTDFQNEPTQNMINMEAFKELKTKIQTQTQTQLEMEQITNDSSLDKKKQNLEAYIEILKYFLINKSDVNEDDKKNLNNLIQNNGRAIFNYMMKDQELDIEQIKSNLEICWFKILIIELEKQSLDNPTVCVQSEFKEYPIIIQYLTDISENSDKSQNKNALFNKLIKLKIKPSAHNFKEHNENGNTNWFYYLYYLESSGNHDESARYISKLIKLVRRTCTINDKTMEFNENITDIDGIVNGIFGEIEPPNNTTQAESLSYDLQSSMDDLSIPPIEQINPESDKQLIFKEYKKISDEYTPFKTQLTNILGKLSNILNQNKNIISNGTANRIITDKKEVFKKIVDYLIKIIQYQIYLLTKHENNENNENNKNIKNININFGVTLVSLHGFYLILNDLPELKKEIEPYVVLYKYKEYIETNRYILNKPDFNSFKTIERNMMIIFNEMKLSNTTQFELLTKIGFGELIKNYTTKFINKRDEDLKNSQLSATANTSAVPSVNNQPRAPANNTTSQNNSLKLINNDLEINNATKELVKLYNKVVNKLNESNNQKHIKLFNKKLKIVYGKLNMSNTNTEGINEYLSSILAYLDSTHFPGMTKEGLNNQFEFLNHNYLYNNNQIGGNPEQNLAMYLKGLKIIENITKLSTSIISNLEPGILKAYNKLTDEQKKTVKQPTINNTLSSNNANQKYTDEKFIEFYKLENDFLRKKEEYDNLIRKYILDKNNNALSETKKEEISKYLKDLLDKISMQFNRIKINTQSLIDKLDNLEDEINLFYENIKDTLENNTYMKLKPQSQSQYLMIGKEANNNDAKPYQILLNDFNMREAKYNGFIEETEKMLETTQFTNINSENQKKIIQKYTQATNNMSFFIKTIETEIKNTNVYNDEKHIELLRLLNELLLKSYKLQQKILDFGTRTKIKDHVITPQQGGFKKTHKLQSKRNQKLKSNRKNNKTTKSTKHKMKMNKFKLKKTHKK